MARTTYAGPQAGPEWVMVQLQIRVPYWRRMQLQEIARKTGVPISAILSDAVDRLYPPEPPK